MSIKKLKTVLIAVIICFVGAGGVMCCFALQKPYAITVGDKTVALVKNEKEGKAAVKKIFNDYKAPDSKVQNVTTDEKIDIHKTTLSEKTKGEPVLSADDAAAYIETANTGEAPLFKATIVGKTVTDEDYTPEIKYVKEEDMIAGEKVVEVKGKKGRQRVTREITTENGVVTQNETLDTKILEKGTAAVIHKGTLGLPEGEDWKTFEGDPVFNGADELVALAEKYQGVPYKYGGTSLVTGVDCVQFVRQIYAKYGIPLPNHHSGLRRSGVPVSYSKMQKGDIICYSRHVAIYIGNGKIIHANSGRGVHISNVYKGQKIVTIRRIVE